MRWVGVASPSATAIEQQSLRGRTVFCTSFSRSETPAAFARTRRRLVEAKTFSARVPRQQARERRIPMAPVVGSEGVRSDEGVR